MNPNPILAEIQMIRHVILGTIVVLIAASYAGFVWLGYRNADRDDRP